jgi:hypothetical protein
MIKRLAIRIVTPISWHWSPHSLARSLNRFSLVEADSAWQMLEALDAVQDVWFRVKLFNNALEEVHHADIFRALATSYSPLPLPYGGPERTPLFDSKHGLAEFEAYHFIGESDVYKQFLAYANSAPSGSLRDTFLAIRGDEAEHQKLAYAQLHQLVGSRWGTYRLIARIRLVRMYQAAKRMGKSVSSGCSAVLLALLYFAAGVFFSSLCRNRLEEVNHETTAAPTP